jgi:hypothetical protein
MKYGVKSRDEFVDFLGLTSGECSGISQHDDWVTLSIVRYAIMVPLLLVYLAISKLPVFTARPWVACWRCARCTCDCSALVPAVSFVGFL